MIDYKHDHTQLPTVLGRASHWVRLGHRTYIAQLKGEDLSQAWGSQLLGARLPVPRWYPYSLSLFFFFLIALIFLKIFDVDHFKSLSWIFYNIASVLCFGFLASRHVGSELPDPGRNPHPLHWRRSSTQSLDHQGSPCILSHSTSFSLKVPTASPHII